MTLSRRFIFIFLFLFVFIGAVTGLPTITLITSFLLAKCIDGLCGP